LRPRWRGRRGQPGRRGRLNSPAPALDAGGELPSPGEQAYSPWRRCCRAVGRRCCASTVTTWVSAPPWRLGRARLSPVQRHRDVARVRRERRLRVRRSARQLDLAYAYHRWRPSVLASAWSALDTVSVAVSGSPERFLAQERGRGLFAGLVVPWRRVRLTQSWLAGAGIDQRSLPDSAGVAPGRATACAPDGRSTARGNTGTR